MKNAPNQGILIGGFAMSFYAKPQLTTDVEMFFLGDDIPLQVGGFKRGIITFQFQENEVEIKTAQLLGLPIWA